MSRTLSLAIALFVCTSALHAQDTRKVSEPVIPPSSALLSAQLSAVDGNSTLAPADETRLDTARIQQALDSCPAGKAVELKAGGARNAFLSGPLQLRAGVTLLVDAGVTLFGSRNAADYEVSPGSCGLVDQNGRGCRPLISGSDVANAAVMGQGTIDGRGWAKLIGKNISWWDLAEDARTSGKQNVPRLMVLNRCDNFALYRITLKNSANFHVTYSNGNGFTVWGVIINTPAKGARNADGIDPSGSTNVTVTHCYIHAGDDHVAIKAGTHASHMTIAHNHFYGGHGMSIGSETMGGAEAIRVEDLSIDGADNGIRIKSNATRGGLVKDVVYRDVCIRNTKNPIFMDTQYANETQNLGRIPLFTGIVLRDVRVLTGGKVTLQGYDAKRRLGMEFDNVQFDQLAETKIVAQHADFKLGPGPVNFPLEGDDVTVTGKGAAGAPNACAGKFVPFPGTLAPNLKSGSPR